MKKFTFRFEKILTIRRETEDRLKMELAEAEGRRQQLYKEKRMLLGEEAAFYRSLEEMKGELDAWYRQQMDRARTYYRREKERLDGEIRTADERVEAKRQEVTEAMKERKTMEKLREKDEQRYLEALEAAERKVIEEIVNYRSFKREGE